MELTSEDFHEHDGCQRAHTWNSRYVPFRVSVSRALNEAIRAALLFNNPAYASDKILSLAANPGLDIESSQLYETVIHLSKLTEVLSSYVLSAGKCESPSPIECTWGNYGLNSFLLPDGRLRRIVLCDRWSAEREQYERFSWRTAADVSVSGRPMLINVLVIGSMRSGRYSSPWVKGFQHPANHGIRIQRREGEFNDNWRMVYREQTSLKPVEWLREMQNDNAFEGRVFSFTEDVPKNRQEVLEHLAVMAGEIRQGSLRQTRSSCYKFRPCSFLPACISNQSPTQMGWVEKTSLIENKGVKLVAIS